MRNATELQNFLDDTLSPRKRELTTIFFMVDKCKRDHELKMLLRLAIPILYAHWEGYIKSSAEKYLEYVSKQMVVVKKLKSNFVALACRSTILEAAPTRKVGMHTQIVDFIYGNMETAVPLVTENAIDTEHNLSPVVLKDIMITIGLDYNKHWATKEMWISQLLKIRNGIAHGELIPVEESTYHQLHKNVIDALDDFKREIEIAVSNKSYMVN